MSHDLPLGAQLGATERQVELTIAASAFTMRGLHPRPRRACAADR
jgi:hypothetical protein